MNWRNKKDLPGILAGTLQVKDSRGRVVLARNAEGVIIATDCPEAHPDFFEQVEPAAPPKLRIVLEEVRRVHIGALSVQGKSSLLLLTR